jgi:hypothetical protein
MILYVNGDSNPDGAEITDADNNSWPGVLAKKINATLIKDTMAGVSNDRIIRTTRELIDKTIDVSKLLVIISTTSWEREEWLYEGKYYAINFSNNIMNMPPDLRLRYKNWIMQQNTNTFAYKSDSYHKKFYDLHCFLSQQNIKHIFFNGIMPFEAGIDFKKFEQFDWGTDFISPYDVKHCYYHYLNNQGFVPTNSFHHTEQAHRHWADFLYDYALSNSYL